MINNIFLKIVLIGLLIMSLSVLLCINHICACSLKEGNGLVNNITTNIRANYGDGWIILKNIVPYRQTTNYTCGPSSLKIALSNYGTVVGEMELAKYAQTSPYSGSTHPGLINAVSKVNMKYNTHYGLSEVKFSDIGWEGVKNHLLHNEPMLLHVESFTHPRITGHYVVITGINMNQGLVKLTDPSAPNGYRILTFNQLKTKMDWIVNTKRAYKVLLPLKV